ncbi:acyl-CoA ligase (AMP-forming), exosortase A system-associated [Sphingosinicella soli]|uniref:Acyl-CoA ligase (AMP-forming) (Exosortase A-associated) n=1 Tax=Sphingosinicella soli TaxID=333708 RepID=A0A7W7AYF7_9SPHN|nr:acyl-CoA ligase (AMP-forming), exosortase A system-associated [Sphingosinicella soli]MBB4630669.1 acyl-CoA ligase (AMP-forming) (exosortase A-associated) [Sphingosinicella soli]
MRVDALHLDHDAARAALIEGAHTTTYGELEALVSTMAGGLAAIGVKPGDRVAIWLSKTTGNVAALLGAMRAGAVAIPVNPVLKAPQVEHIIADSGATVLLTNSARAQTLRGTPRTCRVLRAEKDWGALMTGAPVSVDRAADDLAAILYTSGSTGRPKGVMLSHANLALGAESVSEYLGIGPEDRTLCVLPLAFDYGLNQVLTALRQGGAAILLDYLLPRDVVKAVVRHKATGLAGVPPLWMQLAEVEWPAEARGLRYITNSGGRMPAALTKRLRDLLPATKIYLMYGLTEAFRSTFLDPALVDTHPDSIGRAIPRAELNVLNADGTPAAPGEPGELVHAGPLVAQGYWNDPERTAVRFRPAPAFFEHAGMAVWSGDTVMRDEDGLLYFVGRDDEMMKISGNRVSPTEVEEAIFATGAVSVVAVFGVTDERLGQVVVAVGVPAAGMNGADAEALARQELAGLVPAFMVPRHFIWEIDLPRNPNGKIDRAALRARHVQ